MCVKCVGGKMYNRRKSGILLHVSSLPNDYAIGSLGKEAFDFIDFLYESGMSYWQVLPLNAVFSDPSPYSSISAMATNFYLISIDKLIDYGLLEKSQALIYTESNTKVDYEKAFPFKKLMLSRAFERFQRMTDTKLYSDYKNYCHDNKDFLNDYALFISIKEHYIYKRGKDKKVNDFAEYDAFLNKYGNVIDTNKINDYFYGGCFLSWEENLKFRDPSALLKYSALLHNRIEFYKFMQFIFYIQWQEIKKYANEKGIQIIGDIPLFVNYDSVDVWTNPELFFLDNDLIPTSVAGVPPDYFSNTGQLWGNPLYNWDEHKKQNYSWWKKRFSELYKYVDVVRIDHFRAFDAYWSIPFTEKTAINGVWEAGPKDDFFNSIFSKRKFPIIAEDLGNINESVHELRRRFNLPGMFVAHFHLLNYESVSDLRNLDTNSVIYTGTHDNQTTKSWFNELLENDQKRVANFASKKSEDFEVYDLIRICANSNINTFIIPMQDALELDDASRMNVPGTIPGNWLWRYTKDDLTESVIEKLKAINKDSNRI